MKAATHGEIELSLRGRLLPSFMKGIRAESAALHPRREQPAVDSDRGLPTPRGLQCSTAGAESAVSGAFPDLSVSAPRDNPTLEVHIGPAQRDHRIEPVTRLVAQHERQLQPHLHVRRRCQQRRVLLWGAHRLPWILLRRHHLTPERVRLEPELTALLLLLRAPIQHGEQPSEIMLHYSVAYRLPLFPREQPA